MESNLIGEIIDNKYRVEARLGEGGMGIVYKAWDMKLERPIALKVMRPDLIKDEGVRKRFLIEAKALAKLEHPNIVTVYGFGELQSSFFMVMQFIDGITLAQKLSDSGALPYHQAMPIFKQMLAAIGYVHQNEIIHRDLKPSNVMLTPQSVVKVMDFGVAKIQQSVGATLASMMVGTPRYMSPEQIEGAAKIDRRSDLYSLGMTLYEMLAGRLPFEVPEENFYALAKIIVEHEFFSPRQFNPAVPKRLADIVMKAIAKAPDRRFQNTGEMLAAIEQFEQKTMTIPAPPLPPTQTLIPKPIPAPPKPKRFWERRSFMLATSAILLSAALVVYKLLENSSAPEKSNPPIAMDSTKSKADSTRLTHSALIKELSGIAETKILQQKLTEYRRAMQIAVGKEDDFESLEGCYLFMCEAQRVLGVFQFNNNVYCAVNSAEIYPRLPEQFSGKIAIWVQESSVK